ncbi:MAG: SpoIIE family protein phosphatase [Armatimonadia bacterium]|nr:SpoIIE family protein phosphatase [Armatimonadia bacterium]
MADPIRLLVVDDEPDLELLITQGFRRAIRAGEMEFVFASNGAEALKMVEEDDSIDVVLTDINMPVMDGLTFLLKLSEVETVLKAVVVSAYGDLTNIRTAMNRGAFDFVMKPIDFEDLDTTVRKTIDLVRSLRQAAEVEQKFESIKQELEIAKHIQESIVPAEFPAFPNRGEFDLFGSMVPAREVGGDFYDFFLIDDNRLGLVIADVADKGVPAALFMAVSRTLMRATALMDVPPGPCLTQVNDLLSRENNNAMFVTLFYAVLDLTTGEVTYSDGGHNPPGILRGDGTAELLDKQGGVAVGWLQGAEYSQTTFRLERGDTLFLYTDGVTEAKNPSHDLFGEPRLLASLGEADRDSAQSVVDRVIADVHAHAAGEPQSDDITILATRYLGS